MKRRSFLLGAIGMLAVPSPSQAAERETARRMAFLLAVGAKEVEVVEPCQDDVPVAAMFWVMTRYDIKYYGPWTEHFAAQWCVRRVSDLTIIHEGESTRVQAYKWLQSFALERAKENYLSYRQQKKLAQHGLEVRL